MKKLLQLTTALVLMFSAMESKAQVVNGTLSPDWTFTGIDGVRYHLDSILNAGRTVVIDISAAWCGPCWAYHNSGALDNLWADHGPMGAPGVSATTTDDMMVFLIEGELTNTSQQLHGIYQAPGGYAGSTQGDWTLNTNYPIIDLSSSTPGAGALLADYSLTYFPTCVMICPDRTMTEVDQWTEAQLYAQKGLCAVAVAADDAEMMSSTALNPNLTACDSVIPQFRMGNIGSANLTSCTITYKVDGVVQKIKNWTGNLIPYNNVIVTGVKVGSSVLGSHTVTAEVSNPNGGTDPTISNDVSSASFIILPNTVGPLVVQDFEASGMPANWLIGNGGDATTWVNSSVGYNSTKSVKLQFLYSTTGSEDYFIIDPQSFQWAPNPSLTFDVSYAMASSSTNDKLEVDVSTNCGATWLPRYAKAGSSLSTNGTTYFTSEYVPTSATQWRHETINLTAYANNHDVLIRFKGVSASGNDVYVDNINVAAPTGITEETNVSSVSVYPNPMTNNATVDFTLTDASKVSITLVNALGQAVITSELGNLSTGAHNYSLNTESIRAGLYFLTIKTSTGVITKKVSVNK
jgi:hypothetical protein